MTKFTILFLAAAIGGLLANSATAGTITVDAGQPTFNPADSFVNPKFNITVINGNTGKATGSGTVKGAANSTATISISGTFSANAGEMVSGVYAFKANNKSGNICNYTVKGTTSLGSFSTTGSIPVGKWERLGATKSSKVPIGVSGNYSISIALTFTPPSQPPPPGVILADLNDGTLDLTVEQLDFGVGTNALTGISQSQPLNISTRLAVQGGDNVLIAGFIVAGTDAKKIMVRGLGPSLPVTGAMADPTLELHDASSTIATNDDWKLKPDGTSQQADIEATTIAPTKDAESAILQTVPATTAGSLYTAILSGKNNSTGIGVVELYDLAQAANSRLANISTRGFTSTGDNLLIGGAIIGPAGNASTTVVIRALGPTLGAAGVANSLVDPTLEIHDGNGNIIDTNDNWQDGANAQQINGFGLAPKYPTEAAVVELVSPGLYTAIVRGANNSSGVGLVEVYHLP